MKKIIIILIGVVIYCAFVYFVGKFINWGLNNND